MKKSFKIYYTDYPKMVSFLVNQMDKLETKLNYSIRVAYFYGPNLLLEIESIEDSRFYNKLISEIELFLIQEPSNDAGFFNPEGFRFFPNNRLRLQDSATTNSRSLPVYHATYGINNKAKEFILSLDKAIFHALSTKESSFIIALKLMLTTLLKVDRENREEVCENCFKSSIQIIMRYTNLFKVVEPNDLIAQKIEVYDQLLSSQPEILEYAEAMMNGLEDQLEFEEEWFDTFIEEFSGMDTSDIDSTSILHLIADKLFICDDQLEYLFYVLQKTQVRTLMSN